MGYTAVWTGKTMIVWGGQYAQNLGGIYDPSTDEWTVISPSPPE
jgi:hypothetical protein